jgi:acyl transferase domain-containing protein
MNTYLREASEVEHPNATACPSAGSEALGIAIIGMAGRVPGARTALEFWQNIENGVESITVFSDEELLAAGVAPELLQNPNYVKASPLLADVDLFDAPFFEYSRREAETLDPQHRVFLECAWEALEDAGVAGDSDGASIGVFAGAGGVMSSYLLSESHLNYRLLARSGSREHIGNDKDYLSTRVSYKLNLRGPSLTVQTACSTSLVAIHLACQSLLNGECDMALAGGVTIRIPQQTGYLFEEGHIFSPDGHCRAFDAQAAGTPFGSGVGIVLLKPLEEALADEDSIHAVILGSAINNDGAEKISYWATSGEGQARAIAEALAVAEVQPDTIGYVETHGTGTYLGDPVEIFALTKAYSAPSSKKERQYCAIGSVKSNIGHLDAASGVTGVIKAVMALKHQVLPPSLHFEKPNPRIDFAKTPFYVNTERKEWPSLGSSPRRAAVNSLGIGGTNAHLILEEAPRVAAEPSAGHDLLTLSAKTEAALRRQAARFAEYLSSTSDSWANICYSANRGRAHFKYRLALVAHSTTEAHHKLMALLDHGFSVNGEKGHSFLPSRTQEQDMLYLGAASESVGMEGVQAQIVDSGTQTDRQEFLSSLAQSYVHGGRIDWQGVYEGYSRRKVSLPTYPFERERYWIDYESIEAPHRPSSAIMRHLEEGNVGQLLQQIETTGSFSASEGKLLPKLLDLLVKQHQKELAPDSVPLRRKRSLGYQLAKSNGNGNKNGNGNGNSNGNGNGNGNGNDNGNDNGKGNGNKNVVQYLKKAYESDRESLLIEHLQEVACELLGLDEPPPLDLGFADMGMDSLMMVELRNFLDVNLASDSLALPRTLVLEYPTIESLGGYLLPLLLRGSEEANGRGGEGPPPQSWGGLRGGRGSERARAEATHLKRDRKTGLSRGTRDQDGLVVTTLRSRNDKAS